MKPYAVMLQSITLVITILAGLLMETASAQLSFRSDPYRNTFTIQTPSLQQTFTRYYGRPTQVGGGVGGVDNVGEVGAVDNTGIDSGFYAPDGNIQQQQRINGLQQQQFVNNPFAYSQFGQPQPNVFPQPNQVLSQQRNEQLLQHKAAEQYILQQQRQQQLEQQQNPFITRLSSEELAAYFQQVQRAQQQLSAVATVKPQLVQQQHQQQQQLSGALSTATASSLASDSAQSTTASNLLGVAFSPSNQVSQVKFSSGSGVKYNF